MIFARYSTQECTIGVVFAIGADYYSIDLISFHCFKSSPILSFINRTLQWLELQRNSKLRGRFSERGGGGRIQGPRASEHYGVCRQPRRRARHAYWQLPDPHQHSRL